MSIIFATAAAYICTAWPLEGAHEMSFAGTLNDQDGCQTTQSQTSNGATALLHDTVRDTQ